MSKKGSKNQPLKKELDIVDQQKDPMLRALQKKVRNINKKLTEIGQLQQKKDLKPEQEQKISKKEQISKEKEKYVQMIEVYKDIAVQNEKIFRKAQVAELQDLAAVLAMKEYGVDLGFLLNQNVDNLVRVLTTPTSADLTLEGRIKEISNSLVESAGNNKLKKSIKQFVQANLTLRKNIAQTISNQPQPISPNSQKEREQEIKQLQQEEAQQKSQKIAANEPLTPQVVTVHSPQDNQSSLPPVDLVAQAPKEKQADSPPVLNTVVQSDNPIETKDPLTQGQSGAQQEKREYRQHGERGRRGGRGGRGRDGRNYEDRKYNTKPNFKPKYEDDRPRRIDKDASSSSSRSDSEPKARQFKRQQVRELIEDGFIVVGKPKVKARDQKQYHDHEHGNKHHRHHTKKNY